MASAPSVLQALSPPRVFVFLLAAFRVTSSASYPVVRRTYAELRRRMETVLGDSGEVIFLNNALRENGYAVPMGAGEMPECRP